MTKQVKITMSESKDSNNKPPIVKKTMKQMIREQEERIAKIPKVTPDNAFPDHKHPSLKEVDRFKTKNRKSAVALRQRPQGGCDY